MEVHKVAFLACGWPLASAEAHGTAIALDTDDGTVLVDAGGEVAKGLAASLGQASLARVYLTHEHPDHTWGLPGLVHSLRFNGERGPLPIHGPAPALERVRGALEALGVTTPFELTWHPVGVAGGEDDMAQWVPTEHPVPTVAYRFGDVVVCGDTGPSERVRALARGASLLVHEASHTDAERCHSAGHSTPADAGRVAAQADVGTLALIHVHPSLARSKALEACGFTPAVAPRDGDVLARVGDAWKGVEP